MTDKLAISPFQLTATLVVCRLFTVVAVYVRQPEAGSFFAGAILGFVLQLLLALALMGLADFPGNRSGKGWAAVAKVIDGTTWAVCLVGAAMTVGIGVRLVSDCWYDGRLSLLLLAVLGGAGIFVSMLGLQSMVRAAPLFALIAIAAIGVLMVGVAGQIHVEYFSELVFSWRGTLRTALYNTLGNLELVLLPLLLRHSTKPLRKSAIAAWLGITTAVALLTAVAVMLVLGGYAGGRDYPLYELARSSATVSGGLDVLMMGIWVLPALLRLGVYIELGCEQWGRLTNRHRAHDRRPMIQGSAAVLLSLLLLTGCAGSGIADKSIVTMLELARTGDRVTLRLEYLDLSGGKEEQKYLVCEADCTNIDEGLAVIEREYSRSFYLGGCGLVSLAGEWEMSAMDEWLTALDTKQQLRPMTALVLSDKAVLEVGGDNKQSAATPLRMLFESKGGGIPDSASLKDTLAQLRDPRLSLSLPQTENRDGQAVVVSWRAIK